MKKIELTLEVSNKTEKAIRDVYTHQELTNLVEKFLLDTAEMADPKNQEKLLKESRKIMAELKKVQL